LEQVMAFCLATFSPVRAFSIQLSSSVDQLSFSCSSGGFNAATLGRSALCFVFPGDRLIHLFHCTLNAN
jgi:hypothetical protein